MRVMFYSVVQQKAFLTNVVVIHGLVFFVAFDPPSSCWSEGRWVQTYRRFTSFAFLGFLTEAFGYPIDTEREVDQRYNKCQRYRNCGLVSISKARFQWHKYLHMIFDTNPRLSPSNSLTWIAKNAAMNDNGSFGVLVRYQCYIEIVLHSQRRWSR